MQYKLTRGESYQLKIAIGFLYGLVGDFSIAITYLLLSIAIGITIDIYDSTKTKQQDEKDSS